MLNRCIKKGRTKFSPVLAFILSVTLLASCSGGGNTQQKGTAGPASTTAQAPGNTVSVPAQEPDSSALPAEADGFKFPVKGQRPVAVMIDNQGTRVLPQGGLDQAQVVYEIIVEGGESRYMAVFWGTDPTMIGPVRSSRHYFLDYTMENDAIYVHDGYSPQAISDIRKLKINNIDGITNAGEIFWDLTKDRGNWQDTYTSMQKILDKAKKLKYRTETDKEPVFRYNPTDVSPQSGDKAEKIAVAYSTSSKCSYEFDPATNLYMRSRNGKPQIERVSGKQLRVKNIIIELARNRDIEGDKKGRQEIDTTGSGSGYFITNGKVQKIKWSKADRAARTIYIDETGSEIKLNPGQTWVQVLPLNASYKIE